MAYGHGVGIAVEKAMAAITSIERQLIMFEVWKAIPEFPGCEVSTFGNIKTDGKQHCSDGYLDHYKFVSLRGKILSVHALVMVAFIGPRPKGLIINHIDGKAGNNRLDNLEYLTYRGNSAHGRLTSSFYTTGLQDLKKYQTEQSKTKRRMKFHEKRRI